VRYAKVVIAFLRTDPPVVMFVADKPGTPGVPEAAKVGKTFVTLKWDKPRNDGGSKITGTVMFLSLKCAVTRSSNALKKHRDVTFLKLIETNL
jgi:hypothetical protein